MFITRSQYKRNSLGVLCDRVVVNGHGLGSVITQVVFDPTRVKNRYEYWFKYYYDLILPQLIQGYEDSGYFIKYGTGSTSATSNWGTGGNTSKVKGAFAGIEGIETNGLGADTGQPQMGPIGGILNQIPFFGPMLSSLIGSLFKWSKPGIHISVIKREARGHAKPLAEKSAKEEEEVRVAQEKQIHDPEVTKVRIAEIKSQEAATFTLPGGVIGIKRGALEMKVRGGPVEVRTIGVKK
jgi:hypothetical protein